MWHKLKNKELTKLRRRIGVVFQDYKLLSNKNAYENIAFAMEAVGKAEAEIAFGCAACFGIGGFGVIARATFQIRCRAVNSSDSPSRRAIINQPELIIADEPTGNLDPVNTHEIVQILKKINDLGTTVILTTHNRGVIESVNKR